MTHTKIYLHFQRSSPITSPTSNLPISGQLPSCMMKTWTIVRDIDTRSRDTYARPAFLLLTTMTTLGSDVDQAKATSDAQVNLCPLILGITGSNRKCRMPLQTSTILLPRPSPHPMPPGAAAAAGRLFASQLPLRNILSMPIAHPPPFTIPLPRANSSSSISMGPSSSAPAGVAQNQLNQGNDLYAKYIGDRICSPSRTTSSIPRHAPGSTP